MSRDSHIWKNNLKLAQDRFFGVIFENTGSLDILLIVDVYGRKEGAKPFILVYI